MINSTQAIISSKIKTILPLAIVFMFAAGILLFFPIEETFEYNLDEGINVIKGSLVLKGFPLYKQIWSDQPPIFTSLLSTWFGFFGLSIYCARILILLFSMLLLWSFYKIIQDDWGDLHAFAACGLLIISTGFLRLSSSVMIGLPSLSLAMLSIYLIVIYKKQNYRIVLALSGISMGLSLGTKFFTAFLLLPALLLILKENALTAQIKKNPIKESLIWLLFLISTCLLTALSFFGFDLRLLISQLFQPHLSKWPASHNDFSVIYLMLLQDYCTVILALLSIALWIKQRDWRFLFPIVWLSLSCFILLKHRPVWDHYYPLISIPICWLAGIIVGEFLNGWFIKTAPGLTKTILRWLTAFTIILSINNLFLKYRVTQTELKAPEHSQEQELNKHILGYKSKTNWIFTDLPIFAFYADIPVPPEIAVATIKRRFIGRSGEKEILRILKKYQPEQILLGRFSDYPAQTYSYLRDNYAEIHRTTLYQKLPLPNPCRALECKPIAEYLPSRMNSTRWLHNQIWRSFALPVFIIRTFPEISINKRISVTLWVRNDLAEKSK